MEENAFGYCAPWWYPCGQLVVLHSFTMFYDDLRFLCCPCMSGVCAFSFSLLAVVELAGVVGRHRFVDALLSNFGKCLPLISFI